VINPKDNLITIMKIFNIFNLHIEKSKIFIEFYTKLIKKIYPKVNIQNLSSGSTIKNTLCTSALPATYIQQAIFTSLFDI